LGENGEDSSKEPKFYSAKEVDGELRIQDNQADIPLSELGNFITTPDWEYWMEWVADRSNYTREDSMQFNETYIETDTVFTYTQTGKGDFVADKHVLNQELIVEYDKTTGVAISRSIHVIDEGSDVPATYQNEFSKLEFVEKLDYKCERPTEADPVDGSNAFLLFNKLSFSLSIILIIVVHRRFRTSSY
jgi:hypothetical protein